MGATMNRAITKRRPSRCVGEHTVRRRGPLPFGRATSHEHEASGPPRLWERWDAEVRAAYTHEARGYRQMHRLADRLRPLLSDDALDLFLALDAACGAAATAQADRVCAQLKQLAPEMAPLVDWCLFGEEEGRPRPRFRPRAALKRTRARRQG
jgi:hypothetical protein